MVWTKDADGRLRTFAHDGFGRPWKATDARGTTITAHDHAGRPTRTLLANGRMIQQVYDALGREIRRMGYRGILTQDQRFAYDETGNRTEAVVMTAGEETHAVRSTYDDAGRLEEISATDPDDPESSFATSYA